MGLLTDKVKESGEELGKSWGGSLRDWLETVWGVFLKATLGILLPPPVLEKLFPQTTEAAEVVRDLVLAFIGGISAAFTSGQPQGRLFSYQQDQLLRSFRFDPATLIELIRRDPELWQQFYDDLRDKGWSEKRLGGVQELVKAIPPLADMVRFADFSSFDPEVIEAYREFYDAPDWIIEPFRLVGIQNTEGRDWANKYWFSHFQQPGRYELGEIYRRGLLGEPLVGSGDYGGEEQEGDAERAVKLAYRTQGFSTYWQSRLVQLLREVPTRVDVRRWWDFRTIDETELRSIYQRLGYFGKDLDNYVLWTKVYTDFPVLLNRWSNGWITEEDVRSKLIELGMPAERVEQMIQENIDAVSGAKTDEGKNFTKSEIYKGVKQGVITRDEGVELLMDLNYTRDEAEYLLDINVEVLSGSPDNFAAFKDLTTKYKKAVGREAVTMPEELKQAGERVVKLESDVKLLQAAVKELEDQIIPDGDIPEQIRADLDERRAELARAELELAGARSSYETELARWRHGGG